MPLIRDDVVAQLLCATLLADAVVAALSSGRVVASFESDPDAGSVRVPRVVIQLDGGGAHRSGSYAGYSVGLTAVSSTVAGAMELYGECFRTWQGSGLLVVGLDHRGGIREVERPRSGWHDPMSAWISTGRWILQVVRNTPT